MYFVLILLYKEHDDVSSITDQAPYFLDDEDVDNTNEEIKDADIENNENVSLINFDDEDVEEDEYNEESVNTNDDSSAVDTLLLETEVLYDGEDNLRVFQLRKLGELFKALFGNTSVFVCKRAWQLSG